MGFRYRHCQEGLAPISCLGCRVQGLGIRNSVGFRVLDLGLSLCIYIYRVLDLGLSLISRDVSGDVKQGFIFM